MKPVSLALMIGCLCCAFARAQTSPPTAAPTTPRDTEQTEALREAARLGRTIVQLYGQKKYDEALPLAERAVTLREKALGPDAPLLADTLSNLGALYLAKLDYERAEPAYKRALAIYDKSATESNNVATVLDFLSLLRYVQRDYGQGERYAKRALALKEKRLGPDRIEVAHSLTNLIKLYEAQFETDKAQPLYLRVIEIMEKQSGAVPAAISGVLLPYNCRLLSDKQTAETVALEDRIQQLFTRAATSVRPGNVNDPMQGGVLNGKAICKPQPRYPMLAMQNHVQGTVTVHIVVDETGKVIEAKAVSGPSELAAASEDAARRARFTPTLLSGWPVKVSGIITYNFVLQ
ncbi:MAG: TonB family protein [Pyrinomonadaceae bacterium]